MSPPELLASGGGNEAARLPSGNHSASNFHPERALGQNSRSRSTRASQEFRQSPAANKEHLPDPATVNPLTQGNSLENHVHYPLAEQTYAKACEMGMQNYQCQNLLYIHYAPTWGVEREGVCPAITIAP